MRGDTVRSLTVRACMVTQSEEFCLQWRPTWWHSQKTYSDGPCGDSQKKAVYSEDPCGDTVRRVLLTVRAHMVTQSEEFCLQWRPTWWHSQKPYSEGPHGDTEVLQWGPVWWHSQKPYSEGPYGDTVRSLTVRAHMVTQSEDLQWGPTWWHSQKTYSEGPRGDTVRSLTVRAHMVTQKSTAYSERLCGDTVREKLT
jgi:hypothetical protein